MLVRAIASSVQQGVKNVSDQFCYAWSSLLWVQAQLCVQACLNSNFKSNELCTVPQAPIQASACTPQPAPSLPAQQQLGLQQQHQRSWRLNNTAQPAAGGGGDGSGIGSGGSGGGGGGGGGGDGKGDGEEDDRILDLAQVCRYVLTALHADI